MNRTITRIITAVALAILLVDLFGLFVPAKFGTCWLVIPDALENAFCSDTFVREGRYGFYLNGVFHPSRYLPWFPLLFLAPFQAVARDVYGAVYGCWTAAVGLALLMWGSAYQITRDDEGRILPAEGALAGLMAFPFLLLSPFFISLTGYAMTEVPYLLFCTGAMILWTRLAVRPGIDLPALLWCGVMIAFGGAVRSSAYPMLLLPFLLIFLREKDWKRRFLFWFLTGLPSGLFLVASSAFNWAVFGTPFRSGYHFWCPVPYDFMALTFHPRYAMMHIPRLVREPGFWATLGMFALCGAWGFAEFRKRKSAADAKLRFTAWDAALVFALLQSAVIFALYIFYFFYDKRMYLPITAMMLPLAGSAVVQLSGRFFRPGNASVWVAVALVLILQGFVLRNLNDYHKAIRNIPNDRAKLEILDSMLPGNAVLLSTFNPAVADRFLLRGTDRRVIPVNRIHEYADKTCAPLKVEACDPPPRCAEDNLAPGLLDQPGCYLPFPYALSDDPARLERLFDERVPIYFATGTNRMAPPEIQAVFAFADPELIGQKGGVMVWKLHHKTAQEAAPAD